MSVGVARPTTVAELQALVGTELGPTEWVEVTQERIDAFADATGDHQWIHVDPDARRRRRWARRSPTGC